MTGNSGEIAALLTAVCWTVTALSFEAAGKRIGSLSVNFLRLLFALIMISFYLFITTGHPFPFEAGKRAWIYLSLSGLIGFALGDLFLFQAFVLIGARISMLIYASVPIMTALFGFVFLGETLAPVEILGMALTVAGIVIVVTHGSGAGENRRPHYPRGIVMAVLGSAGQAAGLIISKAGMQGYDSAFGSNMIRIIAGMAGFALIITLMKRWGAAVKALRNRQGILFTVSGSFFGPFLGVSLSLLALRLTSAGVAATIIAIVPVLIIPPAVLIYREKVGFTEIAGAILAVSGVSLLFL